MITIKRLNDNRDMVRSYNIIIDDKYVGKIKRGDTVNFDLNSGEHTIYLKIDWCRSNKVTFVSHNDENIEFECGNSMKGIQIFFSLLYVTFLKNKYLWLKKVDK